MVTSEFVSKRTKDLTRPQIYNGKIVSKLEQNPILKQLVDGQQTVDTSNQN